MTPLKLSLLILTIGLMWVPILGISAAGVYPDYFYRPLPMIMLFFAPHLLISPGEVRALETSGTSRVEELEKAIRDTRGLCYLALVYVVLEWSVSLFMDYQVNNR